MAMWLLLLLLLSSWHCILCECSVHTCSFSPSTSVVCLCRTQPIASSHRPLRIHLASSYVDLCCFGDAILAHGHGATVACCFFDRDCEAWLLKAQHVLHTQTQRTYKLPHQQCSSQFIATEQQCHWECQVHHYPLPPPPLLPVPMHMEETPEEVLLPSLMQCAGESSPRVYRKETALCCISPSTSRSSF